MYRPFTSLLLTYTFYSFLLDRGFHGLKLTFHVVALFVYSSLNLLSLSFASVVEMLLENLCWELKFKIQFMDFDMALTTIRISDLLSKFC